MALLAESLVEEWLNRKGCFTIRGVKHGQGEMDLLAVRPESDGALSGWHVEVTVSFRPIGYIAPDRARASGRRDYVRKRTPAQVRMCARAYVDAKFRDAKKVKLREQLWPGVIWSFHLVHGVVRYPDELQVFGRERVTCHPFYQLLDELSQRHGRSFSGSAGGDLAEIASYYKTHQAGNPYPYSGTRCALHAPLRSPPPQRSSRRRSNQ